MINIKILKKECDQLAIFREDFPNISTEDVMRKKKFHSPFSKEKTPSFNLKFGRNGEIRFEDYSSGKNGDCVKYVMERKNMTVPQTLKYINDKQNLGLNGEWKISKKDERWNATYFEKITNEAKRFWRTYGVSEAILSELLVRQIRTLIYKNKDGKPFKNEFEKKGVLAFEFVKNGRRKCYIPKQSGFEFKGIFQTCIITDLFGGKAVKKGKDSFGVLCEGEKDTLIMHSMGFTAYCLQSVNVDLTKENLKFLKSIANDWIIVYDNDVAGRSNAKKISIKWNLPVYWMNKVLEEGQDIGDWAKSKRSKGSKSKDKQSGLEKWQKAWRDELRATFEKIIQSYKLSNQLNIWEQDNGYYRLIPDEKDKLKVLTWKKKPISNFIIENEVFIESEIESQRIVRLKSNTEQTNYFSIPTDSFVSINAFKTFAESKGNFYFFGISDDLTALKRHTFLTAKKAVQVTQMGYDLKNECFVLSNCIITNDGRILNPDKYGIANGLYIPSADNNNRFNPNYGTDRKYIFQENPKLKIWDWFNGLSESYNVTAAIIGMAHITATLFYDIITKEHLKLPLLNIWGQKGSGKNSFVEMLLNLFGKDENLTHLGNSTSNKVSRVMSHTANIPQWLDEYKTGIRNHLSIVEVLKGFYDRTGRGKATTTNDTKTKQDKILTSAIISGQETIKDEALLSRLVTLQFPTIKEDKEKSKLFFRWQNAFRLGLGHVLVEILSFRPIIEKELKNKVQILKEIIGNEMIDRGLKITARLTENYAVLLSPLILCLENGAKLLGQNTNAKNEIETLLLLVFDNIEKQAKNEEERDEVTAFWEVFFAMAERNLILKSYDFEEENGQVYLTAFVFQEYEKFNRQYGKDDWLGKNDVIAYMKLKEYYVEYKKRSLESRTNEGKKQKKCHVCDIQKMPKVIQERFEEISRFVIKENN